MCSLKSVLSSDRARPAFGGWDSYIISGLCNSQLREDLSPLESRREDVIGDVIEVAEGVYRYLSQRQISPRVYER